MSRVIFLLSVIALLSACSPPIEPQPDATPPPNPPAQVAKPTPKPGEWMWKEHGPLDEKPTRH